MERIIDEIMLLALCVALMVSEPASAFAIIGMLAAMVVVCVCEVSPIASIRYACICAYVASALFLPELLAPLPLVAYECVAQRSSVVRFVWIVVLLFDLVRFGWWPLAGVVLLCGIASAMAVRTARNLAERSAMRSIRDGLREQLNVAQLNESAVSRPGSVAQSSTEENASSAGDRLREAAGLTGLKTSEAIDGLTDREQSVAALVAKGLDNKEIASELYLSEGTVRNYISSILQKCQLKNRTQIAIMYLLEVF